ncbi:hypothetical protein ACVWXY_002592 [Thermostichus sp. MS-CIW-39]
MYQVAYPAISNLRRLLHLSSLPSQTNSVRSRRPSHVLQRFQVLSRIGQTWLTMRGIPL